MKSKVAFLGLVSLLFTFAATAQEIENDDMYFNSKDRAKLNAARASDVSYTASIKKNKKEKEIEAEPVNPTDSYSARNVNPEYQARTNAETAQADNEDYFVNNYHYNNASNFNNWNNNFNRWYSNPWYGGNYYDPFINSWNTPYYGSYYDSWGNPWRNPYYRSGWSSSFSYHWGSSWDYGWGMNFGYGNYGYVNPYYNAWAWNPYYGGYSPWSSYSYYGYPSHVIIVEPGHRNGPVYGKRGSRSGERSRTAGNGNNRSYNRGLVESNDGGRTTTGGRMSTNTSRTQSDYYNRSWRTQSNTNSSYNNENSGYSNPNSGNTNRSSWESNTRSSWSNGDSNTRSSGSSGRSSTGGGSSSGSSGGSSSGSRSSGRGH
ncbi:hypothetical protein [Chryseolinea sp. H1M3-3]|uniref:hypothetical protein n=1 Tax=Chryseolinea sp. H1M3-3 TaxID=3034144 RepID=UPI0023EE0861|nr:hypothetical protein [Chryseolinea sp. H1M3-3]